MDTSSFLLDFESFLLEAMMVVSVIIAVPVFLLTLEKILKKKIYNNLLVLLIYLLIFLLYLDTSERRIREIEDSPVNMQVINQQ